MLPGMTRLSLFWQVNVDARMLLAGGQVSSLAAFSHLENGEIFSYLFQRTQVVLFFCLDHLLVLLLNYTIAS